MPCGTLPHMYVSQTPQQIPNLWQHPSQCFCCFDPHPRDTNLPTAPAWGSGVGFCCFGFFPTHRQKQRAASDLVQHFPFRRKTARQQPDLAPHCNSSFSSVKHHSPQNQPQHPSAHTGALCDFKPGPADPQGQQHCPPTKDNPCANFEGNFSRDYLCYYTD